MRIKKFDITTEVLKQFLAEGRYNIEIIQNAIPKDAELVRININPNESTPSIISLYFTSQSFPDLPEGSYMQSEKIELRQYYFGDKIEVKSSNYVGKTIIIENQCAGCTYNMDNFCSLLDRIVDNYTSCRHFTEQFPQNVL